MVNQPAVSAEHNFVGGLKTEFTGLNFPENAATDADNTVFTIIGDVLRREGIDYENNFALKSINRTGLAISTYKWNNVGGDGLTQIVVTQVGGTLYFWRSSTATLTTPLSTQNLASTVTLSTFTPAGGGIPDAVECQYTDGNGYLFVFHPNLEPFYCTYSAGTIVANQINVQIRDTVGIPEPGVADNLRPLLLSTEHQYNLQNQGWTQGSVWTATSTTSITVGIGARTFIIQTGLTITPGQVVQVVGTGTGLNLQMTGTVSSYVSGTGSLTLSVTSAVGTGINWNSWSLTPTNLGFINTWFSAVGTYPSNADVWWQFKNSSNVFAPATTFGNVTLNSGPAPKGYFILSAFNQQRSLASGTAGIIDVTTTVRPKTGCWFQGRVWYTGVDASFPATGDMPFSTWSENLYFSQIIVRTDQFGKCYETNDPTSETLFDLLPTDGGVIQIQGCGSIFKIFPYDTGLLVFASNGIWYIAGSQGVGFAANDYTINKVSSVQSLSSTSFVSVQGMPIFWNEEGIYTVSPGQQDNQNNRRGIFSVDNLALGTILSFFADIPLQSKKFARGAYHPLEYTVEWLYKELPETDVTSRYKFDSVLVFNTATKAFYTYSIANSTTSPYVNGIEYVAGPGGSTSPDPVFKYFTSVIAGATYNFTFSEERDITYVDWKSTGTGLNFVSFFETGYKLHGQGYRRWQPGYITIYLNNIITSSAYKIQGIWDYAINRDSGKFSSIQLVTNNPHLNFGKLFNRHRIRGQGNVLQFKITSSDGKPFDIQGWVVWENINASV